MLQGILGFLMSMGVLTLTLCVTLVLPTIFFTAVWNAFCHNLLGLSAIDFLQGSLLWMMVFLGILLWLKPEVKVELKSFEEDDFKLPVQMKRNTKDAPSSSKAPPSAHWLKWRNGEKDKLSQASKKAKPPSSHS